MQPSSSLQSLAQLYGAFGATGGGAGLNSLYQAPSQLVSGATLGSNITPSQTSSGGTAAKPQVQAQNLVSPVNSVQGTAGYGFNQQDYINGIQQEYNASIGGASNAIAQNQANLGINQGLLNNYIGTHAAGAQNVANTQIGGIQGQQQLSLAELADSIRAQNQGLQAQLGAVGAGSSSASQMGQLALGKQQNQSAANINQQAGSNIANINAQTQSYLDTLNSYKNQQMQTILQNYNSLQNQLLQQIGTAQGEEKARLAQFGQALKDSAGAGLTSLDQQVQAATQNFASQQQAVLANHPGDFQAPTPKAIQVPQVSPFSIPTTSGNNTSAPTGGSLASLLQKTNQQ